MLKSLDEVDFKYMSYVMVLMLSLCSLKCIQAVIAFQDCHGQGKIREKEQFFKVRGKSWNFVKDQGKS